VVALAVGGALAASGRGELAAVAAPIAGLVAGVLARLWLYGGSILVFKAACRAPIARLQDKSLIALLEALCLGEGLSLPRLYVLRSRSVQAACLKAWGGYCLVLSEGLLSRLNRTEVEGVLAHLLARIEIGTADSASHRATALCPACWIAPVGLLARSCSQGGIQSALVAADLRAALITRFPPALSSALAKARACADSALRGPRWAVLVSRLLLVPDPAEPFLDRKEVVRQRIDLLEDL
jgi:Zn-dependent protease with chaperone function